MAGIYFEYLYYIQIAIIGAFFVANNIINIIFIKIIQTIDNVNRKRYNDTKGR